MADAIECDRLVLKILDQRTFQIVVQIVLQKDIEGFYDNLFVRRLGEASMSCARYISA
jgi:hypothetical protein